MIFCLNFRTLTNIHSCLTVPPSWRLVRFPYSASTCSKHFLFSPPPTSHNWYKTAATVGWSVWLEGFSQWEPVCCWPENRPKPRLARRILFTGTLGHQVVKRRGLSSNRRSKRLQLINQLWPANQLPAAAAAAVIKVKIVGDHHPSWKYFHSAFWLFVQPKQGVWSLMLE